MSRREVDGLQYTAALGSVLEVLLKDQPGMAIWPLAEAAGLTAVRVTSLIDDLEDRSWVAGEWEEGVPDGQARRRFYRLTPIGWANALALLGRYDDL
ncbi:helix-turn-helix transcriptional regulator [Nonomuraea sp. SYSU D8015]|uniref:helix-turn-helix transcriptional regulator n=1 Tax=Nonomuraea sp. SYSU D8015 TaxID=2593644 RepID=UPI001660D8BE|nr:helix-turn-helix transcriptional regulator [Nonomuraea sp. SYSU D8015]